MTVYIICVDEWVARTHYVHVEAASEADALDRVRKVVNEGHPEPEDVSSLSDGRLWEVEGGDSYGRQEFDDLSKVDYSVREKGE